jgi:diguanylate cyclase (GGDEF)-like protein
MRSPGEEGRPKVQALTNELQSGLKEPLAPMEAPRAAHDSSAATHVDDRLHELSSLLEYFEPSASPTFDSAHSPEAKYENRLAQVRLGMAGSLFTALRCKNAATAAHSVRVALGCSAWALALEMADAERDSIEVAALLHDIGKIGVADRLLLKPGPLTSDEHANVDLHRQMGLQILESCCASPAVLQIVREAPLWFDGSRSSGAAAGLKLALGARMLAIVDAFDSMTTPQVYRPAMSHDRAIKELCDFAGTQFDPQLVINFAELQAIDQRKLHHRVARRWLQEIDPNASNLWWESRAQCLPSGSPSTLHHQRLLENMYEGVIFLDMNLQVMLWNRGTERLTGISGGSMFQKPFAPSLVRMRDETGSTIPDAECPVAHAIRTGVQSLRRVIVAGRSGRDLAVDVHTIPVVGPDGATQGASLLWHDASGEASLEERCHSLYEQAIRDPLTQLANRAEFDRVHAMFVEAHLERRLPCSLIMCDIDRFKQVNDNYGHQAGDEAIKSFAQLMKSACRPGDLVARYGGEEFVMLCADCNNSTAAGRAEELRKGFQSLSQAALGGKNCTASFGVTEIQPGDNVQTMLNRADRALLMAKEGGRNLVVQLGSGLSEEPTEMKRGWRFWRKAASGPLLDKHLVSNVPIDITIEKLRGFVSDHQAEIISLNHERIEVVIHPGVMLYKRRKSDRAVPLVVELKLSRGENAKTQGGDARGLTETQIHVTVRAKKGRDRRSSNAMEQARHVIAGLRSYLMANDAAEPINRSAGSSAV